MLSSTVKKVYERSGKNLSWSIKNSSEILDKLKARGMYFSKDDFPSILRTVGLFFLIKNHFIYYLKMVRIKLILQ